MKTNNANLLKEMAQVFPSIAGVVPVGATEGALVKVFNTARVNVATDGVEILRALREVYEAARSAGLTLTVNDLRRVVREKIRELKLAQQGKAELMAFPSMYKGVSFNPQTYSLSRGKGEWLVLLDFYSIMRAMLNNSILGNRPLPKFYILDAGLYWVINLMGKEAITVTAATPQDGAQQILSLINRALVNPEFKNIILCNRIRNAYLRSIAGMFPANCMPQVFTLKDVWNDPQFPRYLSESLQAFGQRNNNGRWEVKNPVLYERYMPYSQWVTPLAAAETVFVGEKLKVYGILSPTAEASWNKVNDMLSRRMKKPAFISWMYTRNLGKILSYDTVPFFSDTSEIINRKFENAMKLDPSTPELILKIISPFVASDTYTAADQALKVGNLKYVSEYIYEFIKPIENKATEILKKETEIPAMPLDQAGWLGQFPPGIC